MGRLVCSPKWGGVRRVGRGAPAGRGLAGVERVQKLGLRRKSVRLPGAGKDDGRWPNARGARPCGVGAPIRGGRER